MILLTTLLICVLAAGRSETDFQFRLVPDASSVMFGDVLFGSLELTNVANTSIETPVPMLNSETTALTVRIGELELSKFWQGNGFKADINELKPGETYRHPFAIDIWSYFPIDQDDDPSLARLNGPEKVGIARLNWPYKLTLMASHVLVGESQFGRQVAMPSAEIKVFVRGTAAEEEFLKELHPFSQSRWAQEWKGLSFDEKKQLAWCEPRALNFDDPNLQVTPHFYGWLIPASAWDANHRQQLVERLNEKSRVARIVRLTSLTNEYLLAQEDKKPNIKKEIDDVINVGGPAEQLFFKDRFRSLETRMHPNSVVVTRDEY